MSQEVGVILRVHAKGENLLQFFIANSVARAGDVNGDGFDDIACAIQKPETAGETLVLLGPLYPADCDRNGVPDTCQIEQGAADQNGNGVPDACELVRFRRGDVSADGRFDISDPVSVLRCLFLLESCPVPCVASGDVDGSGEWNITDAIYSLNYLFLGGPAPVRPFEDCGTLGLPGGLPCAAYPPCD